MTTSSVCIDSRYDDIGGLLYGLLDFVHVSCITLNHRSFSRRLEATLGPENKDVSFEGVRTRTEIDLTSENSRACCR